MGVGGKARGRTVLHAVLFGLWFVGISVPLAMLAVHHDLPLARHAPSASAAASASAIVRPTIRHVLAADCPCSQAVATRLLARSLSRSEREEVWIVGDDRELRPRLAAAGYTVRTATADEAARELGIIGAPLLIVYDAQGREVYAGGYGPRRVRVADDAKIDAIVSRVRAGRSDAPYPAFGCIVGEELRRRVDPLRLKYAKARRDTGS